MLIFSTLKSFFKLECNRNRVSSSPVERLHVELWVASVESDRGKGPALRMLELALPLDDEVQPLFLLRIDH